MRVFRRSFLTSLLIVALVCAAAPSGHAEVPAAVSPLTLEDAIRLGLKHHPLAQYATANIALAKAGITRAKASALPSIGVSEEVIVSNDPVFAFGTKLRQARFTTLDFGIDSLNHPSAIGNFESSATVNWTAYDFGATQAQIRDARAAFRAAELNRSFTDQEIADRITMLFYRVLLAESQVTAAQTNLVRSREIAADIRDRVHSGLALEADGMRADIAARNAEDDLVSAQANVHVAREDLFEVIGEPQQKGVALVIPTSNAESKTTGTAPLATRLDLQALDLQRTSVQQNLVSIRASAWPKLSTYARVESDNRHFTSGGSSNWAVGAKLEISVFDGGARRGREQEAAGELAKITAQKEQTKLTADSRIRELQAQISDLQRRYDTASDAIDADQEALRASRDRYAAGLVPVSEVLNGEADLAAAEFARIRSFYQLCIANSNLQLANGTLTISNAGQPQ